MDFLFDVFIGLFDVRLILFVFLGALSGLLIGALPGLSVTMATSLLVSITYSWNSSDAISMIMGVYVVGVFAGSISAILLNIPGAPSSIVTVIEGYPLAKKGRAYEAIRYSCVYSFVGTFFGFIALAFLAKFISKIAIGFAPIDYFLLAVISFFSVGAISNYKIKTYISACIGLILSLVGIDSISGLPKLTFGIYELNGGFSVVPILIGIFGISQVMVNIYNGREKVDNIEIKKVNIKFTDLSKYFKKSLLYSAIGSLIGALPGAGGPVASQISYAFGKKTSKEKDEYLKGSIEGLVASESANNACVGGALIPMLSLGIPGDAVTAVLLGVFLVHGLNPGPLFISTNLSLFSSIISAGIIGSIFLLILGIFVAPRVAKLLKVNPAILNTIIIVLCIVGSYSIRNRVFDVYVMLIFGILGFFMREKNYPVAPLVLGVVLGRMMDDNLRRSLSLFKASGISNNLTTITPFLLIIIISIVIFQIIGFYKK